MALSIIDKDNHILSRELKKVVKFDSTPGAVDDVDIFRYNWYSKLVPYVKEPGYKKINC